MSGRTPVATDFWSSIGKSIQGAAYETMGRRMVVDTISGGLVRLKDISGDPGGVAPYIGVETLIPTDEVWVEPVATLRVDGKPSRMMNWVVMGKIHRTAATVRMIDGTILKLIGGLDLAGYNDAGTVQQWSIDSATGAAIFGSVNTPLIVVDSQSSADNPSTTSTSTYATAMTTTLALGAGTWAVRALCFCGLKHSTDQTANFYAEIDGNLGTVRALTCPSATYRMCIDDASIGGIAGNQTINIRPRFKASDAGTITANNPAVIAIATKTGN